VPKSMNSWHLVFVGIVSEVMILITPGAVAANSVKTRIDAPFVGIRVMSSGIKSSSDTFTTNSDK
jgi:hypothetical protein